MRKTGSAPRPVSCFTFSFRAYCRGAGCGFSDAKGPPPIDILLSYLKLYGGRYGLKNGKPLTGIARSVPPLNEEMYLENSIPHITEPPFPVLLISGEEDMICPVVTVQRRFDALRAPKKEYVKIKKRLAHGEFRAAGGMEPPSDRPVGGRIVISPYRKENAICL